MGPLGDFDVVLQITGLDHLLSKMHREGTVPHHAVVLTPSRRIELVLGPPKVEEVSTAGRPAQARTFLSMDCRASERGNAADPGFLVRVSVGATVTLDLAQPGPNALPEPAGVRMTWAVDPSAISFRWPLDSKATPQQQPSIEADVRDAVIGYVARWSTAIELPALAGVRTADLALTGSPSASGPPYPRLALGLDLDGVSPGSAADLESFAAQGYGWNLAFSAGYLSRHLGRAMHSLYGADPIAGEKLVLPDVNWGGIPLPVTPTVVGLRVVLATDAMQLRGTLSVAGTTLPFTYDVSLAIDARRAVVATMSRTPTWGVLEGPLASTGGDLQSKLSTSLDRALETAGIASGGGPTLLGRLWPLSGVLGAGPLDLSIGSVEVAPFGVVVSADALDWLQGTWKEAVPDISVAREPLGSPGPARVVIDAGPSWAPGGTLQLVRCQCKVGGSAVAAEPGGWVFATDLDSGRYVVELTVVDDTSAVATRSWEIFPGVAVLEHERTPPWIVHDKGEETFRVTHMGEPLAGVPVNVFTHTGYPVTATTGADGRATLLVDPARFDPVATAPQPPTSGLLVAWAQVDTKDHALWPAPHPYLDATHVLWASGPDAIDPVVIWRRKLLDWLGWPIRIDEALAGRPVDPTSQETIGEVRSTAQLLASVVETLAAPRGVALVAELLRVERGPDLRRRTVARLDALFAHVAERVEVARRETEKRLHLRLADGASASA